MKKFYSEWAYGIGLLFLAFGTAFMEAADFGMSMVVAPAYLVFRKLSEGWSFFTFGMAEWVFQAGLLVVMMLLLKSFKVRYLFSFVTAFLYGLILDGSMILVGFIPSDALYVRGIFFVFGLLLCALGVALLFHTYITPEVYELFVKEISNKYRIDIHKCKWIYDLISCALAIMLSFLFFGFGHFEGVKWGTVVCALTNGWIIGVFSAFLEKHFTFVDKFRRKK